MDRIRQMRARTKAKMERQIEAFSRAKQGYEEDLLTNVCPHARASHTYLAGECAIRIRRAEARLEQLALLE